MSLHLLEDLLTGNAAHVEAADQDRIRDVEDGQEPPVVSLCCSDSRVPQERMFDVTDPGFLFTPSNIGNQARAPLADGPVVDGNLLYPLVHTGTRFVAVVGHTGCGAVTAAYQAVTGDMDLDEEPPGIQAMVEQLVPVVRRSLGDGEAHRPDDEVVNDLVERNVDDQVAFLLERDEVPPEVTVAGLVYDLHGAYGGPRGTTVVTNVDGETDPAALRDRVPSRFEDRVGRRVAEVSS